MVTTGEIRNLLLRDDRPIVQIAKKIGIDRTVLDRFVREQNVPGVEKFLLICAEYGIFLERRREPHESDGIDSQSRTVTEEDQSGKRSTSTREVAGSA